MRMRFPRFIKKHSRQAIIASFAVYFLFAPMLDALAQTRNRETNTLRQMQPRTESRIEQSQKSTARRDSVPQSTYSRPRERKPTSYAILMRRFFNEKLRGEDLSGDLTDFIEKEKERLNRLKVPAEKTRKYLDRLFEMNLALERGDIRKFTEQIREVKIPKNPAKFGFGNKDKIRIKSISINNVKFGKGEKSAKNSKPKKPPLKKKLRSALETLFGIPSANAQQTNYLPVIEDIQPNPEVQINYEIKELARSLENNPVKIFNFVRNSIAYEPYFGAKKGSVGCLREQVCNDTDTASLTIALLRASGTPARYKTSLIIKSVDEWKNLLGVDETKTVYAALSLNKMPVYTLTDANQGKGLNDADFSIETHLAVEWTFAEVFYEYDERGGNISNHLDLNQYKTTEELQNALSIYTKKQWIPIDVIVRQYNHDKKPILADSANFNAENFFYDFLKYQGDKNPIEKYTEDIESATGLKLQDNLSTKTYSKKNFDILPASLPYSLSEGIDENGNEIVEQTFSVLSDSYRYQIKISLLKASDESSVLEKTFFASEINNKELTLTYTGATDADNAIIESYGGIHATPSELVSIKAILRGEYESFEGASPFSIGDSLILRFAYSLNGEELYKDEKFSTAGNHEGIYVSLSKVQIDPSLDTDSNILLRGNVGLARKYLERIESNSKVLKQSLDYDYQISFSRAVVTQNRILNLINNIPSTFDFKGLTLDASAYINDYSNSGDYKNHQKDFRLLWGQFASYYEGQLFTDITGLEAISTVKGLQYAYSKPAEYTIHTITSANESEIDSLALSENTKTNMHADIQNGNTIITPDKFVSQGVWKGILYVSLDPAWTATYAIGEQSQTNGGLTSIAVTVDTYCDSICHLMYFSSDGIKKYVYEDRDVASVQCKISEKDYLDIISDVGVKSDAPIWEKWSPEYGAPCYKDTKQFETVFHTFILATNATKFDGSTSKGSYNYWVQENNAKQMLVNNNPGYSFNTFKFNPIAGTYSYHNGADHTAYYQPVQPTSLGGNKWEEHGNGWIVYGDILSKLQNEHYDSGNNECKEYGAGYCVKQDWVLNILGFPLGKQDTATESSNGTEGFYQDFAGGQIYIETEYLNETYYVPGKIDEFYNQNGSTSGVLGFPTGDPKFKNNGYVLQQIFENKHAIELDTITNLASIKYAPAYACDVVDGEDFSTIGSAFLNGFLEGGSTGIAGVLGFMGIAIGGGIIISGVTYITGGIALPIMASAEVVALTAIGVELSGLLTELMANPAMIDQIFAGAETWVKNEVLAANNNCPARRAYLVARYGTGILTYIVGFKQFKKLSTFASQVISGEKVVTTLQAFKQTFKDELKAIIKTNSDDVIEPFIQKAEIEYANATEEMIKKTGSILSKETTAGIAKKSYYGLAYDSAIETELEKFSKTSGLKKLKFEGLKEIKIGASTATGAYEKGAHIYEELEKKIINGVWVVRDPATGKTIKSLQEVMPDNSGVRKVEILKANGEWKKLHTVFPKGISQEQWTQAVEETATSGQEIGNLGFEKVININGKNIKVKGFFDVNKPDEVATAYPDPDYFLN